MKSKPTPKEIRALRNLEAEATVCLIMLDAPHFDAERKGRILERLDKAVKRVKLSRPALKLGGVMRECSPATSAHWST